MTSSFPAVPWLCVGLLALFALLILRRPLGILLRLLLRSSAALAFLAAVGQIGEIAGIALGVNWINALVLGVLGVPGLGLLLMLQWALRV